MDELRVVGLIKAKKGKEVILAEVLKKVADMTRKEPGCVSYQLHNAHADATLFVTIEGWKSPAAVQQHLSSAHVAEALARKDELIENLEIHPLACI